MANRTLRKYQERERLALRSGNWGPWHRVEDARPPRTTGWLSEVHTVWKNHVFAVLVRTVQTACGPVQHAAIRNVSETDIPWAAMQRIKDEIFGPRRVAVEVFPPADELVDEANMYHLWILPEGFALPFTLTGGGHVYGVAVPTPTLEATLAEVNEWQRATFPDGTARSAAVHLLKEAHELAADPHDAEEMADVLMLVAGVADRAGVDLHAALRAKLEKNRQRKWGKPDADGVVEHVREPEGVAHGA